MRAPLLLLAASLLHEARGFSGTPVLRSAGLKRARGGATITTQRMTTPTLYVKQAQDGSAGLGDCPFSHKAHMALKLRKIPFTCEYINLQDKPSWYLELNEKGSVPTLKGEQGTLITDSDDIVSWCDGRGEGATLLFDGQEEAGGLAVAVWKAFATIMKNKDEAEEKALEANLRKAVGDLDSYISSRNTRFLLGDSPSAVDCKAGPFLLHSSVALPHYKGIDPFQGSPAVKGYFANLQELEAFRETSYGDSVIIAGKRHLKSTFCIPCHSDANLMACASGMNCCYS